MIASKNSKFRFKNICVIEIDLNFNNLGSNYNIKIWRCLATNQSLLFTHLLYHPSSPPKQSLHRQVICMTFNLDFDLDLSHKKVSKAYFLLIQYSSPFFNITKCFLKHYFSFCSKDQGDSL